MQLDMQLDVVRKYGALATRKSHSWGLRLTASGDAGNSGGKKGHLANQPTYLYHMIFRYFIPVKCIAFSILVGIEA
jgi:hypothetical protein